METNLKLFTGNSAPALAGEIARFLKAEQGKADVGRFPDGETDVKIMENVRGTDSFVIQSTSRPANNNLMELLLLIDALRRASANRITAVIPYYGYGRADRKAEPRVPISAKLVANLIVAAGANRVLTLDLHAGQIQGFFDIPVDHLYANKIFIDYFRKKNLKNLIVVSPDAGSVDRARAYAKRLKCDIAIIDKRRLSPKDASVMNVVGDVKGKTALVTDDLVDTAGTLVKASEALLKAGAINVYACCTHGILADPAMERLKNSKIVELVITNSIPLDSKINSPIIKVLSVAPILAEAIKRIHDERSISELFI